MANVVKLECRMPYTNDDEAYGPYAITTWHASWNDLTGDAESCAEALRLGVVDFFNATGPSGRKVNEYLSSILSGVAQFRWFDWSLPKPRPGHELPNATIAVTTTGDALPPQVAACLSTKCDPYGSHRRQSFYNRQFIGPLNDLTLSGDSGRPSPNFRVTMAEGYQKLLDRLDIVGIDIARACVFSPTHDSSGLVTSYWCDDAFDIQRRRELDPTVKDVVEV